LAENRLGRIAPEAPILLNHARRDQIVSFVHSLDLRDDWRALGVDVRLYVTRGGVDHITGAAAGMPVAVDWLARRFRAPRSRSYGAGAVTGAGVDERDVA
jgi:predicted esterase